MINGLSGKFTEAQTMMKRTLIGFFSAEYAVNASQANSKLTHSSVSLFDRMTGGTGSCEEDNPENLVNPVKK